MRRRRARVRATVGGQWRFAFCGPGEIVEPIQQMCPTGKSLLILRNRVKPRNRKYFASPPTQISSLIRTVSFRQEGRIARRHETRDGMRWTRRRQASNSEPDE
jgi:hypothetical protein